MIAITKREDYAMAKEDIRILKTKRDLRAGIVSLLKTRPFEKITVCDICEESIINRMTFYKHYMDKKDLLEDLIKVTKGKFELAEINDDEACEYPAKILTLAFKKVISGCVESKDELVAISEYDKTLVWEIVYKPLEDVIKKVVTLYDEKVKKSKFPVEIVSVFISGGLLKLIDRAIKQEEKFSQESEKMAESFFNEVFTTNTFFDYE